MMLSLIFLVFALVLAILAGFIQPATAEPTRARLICFSLACFFAAELVRLVPLAIKGGGL